MDGFRGIHRSFLHVAGDERGIAILQVVFAGTMVMLAALALMQYMNHNDREAMRLIRRNQNLNYSIDIANFVNDAQFVKGAATTLHGQYP
jgi:hypothetical protein